MTNFICTLGSISFGLAGCYWNSNIMLMVSTLGVIFHINNKNKLLYLIDLSTNSILTIIACYLNNDIIPLLILASLIFSVNTFLLLYSGINIIIINIQHVVLVQGLGLYGYYILYRHTECSRVFFDCTLNSNPIDSHDLHVDKCLY